MKKLLIIGIDNRLGENVRNDKQVQNQGILNKKKRNKEYTWASYSGARADLLDPKNS